MRRFFRLPLSERTVAAEVDDEVSFHIESRVEELVRLGWREVDARSRALREFGDVRAARDELMRIDRGRVRRRRRADLLDAARQDVVLALRMVRREPGFALAVVLTLGLGIGLNAVMFGITDRLLFQPPAQVTNPGELKRLYFSRTSDWVGYWGRTTNYATYSALRSGVRAYQDMGAYFTTDGSLGRGQGAQKVRWLQATASLIPTLGVRPHIGRFFTDEDDRPGRAEAVVVLSYPFWQRHFGGERSALGQTLYLGNQTYTVIGVAPRGFTGVDLEPVDLFTPLSAAAATMFGDDWATTRSMAWLRVVARLRPGATVAQANEQATSIFKAGSPDLRDDAAARVSGESIILARAPSDGGSRTTDIAQIALWLSGVSLLVLAIACANVMNLLLARATRRRREVTIRLALGVGRLRLVGHFLIETMMLALAGGITGLLFAQWAGPLARGLLLPDLDWSMSPLSGRVLGYTGVLVLLCGVVAGLTPALHTFRSNLIALLNSGVRAGGQPGARIRNGLILLQAAFSILLLVGAGLFVRSLRNVSNVHKGFDADRVLVLAWDLNLLDYTRQQTHELYQEAATRVKRVPGVANAAVGMTVPFWMWMRTDFRAQGIDSVPQTEDGGPYYNAVSPEYFATLGTRIMRGRGFTDRDRAGAQLVAIVSETMERLIWRGEPALGKCVYLESDTAPCTIVVGIAEDALRDDLSSETMQYYLPLEQVEGRSMRSLFIRTNPDAESLMPSIRQALQSLRPDLPFADIRSLEQLMGPHVRPWRLGANLFATFGILALLLAGFGLYSVVAYSVAQRTQEMSVRLALGAAPRHVLGSALGSIAKVVLSGMMLGVLAALVVAPKVASLLFEVSPRDPTIIAAVVVVLALASAAAAALPARRVLRIEPARALQME